MEKEVTPFLEFFLPVDLKGNEMESLQWEQVAPFGIFSLYSCFGNNSKFGFSFTFSPDGKRLNKKIKGVNFPIGDKND